MVNYPIGSRRGGESHERFRNQYLSECGTVPNFDCLPELGDDSWAGGAAGTSSAGSCYFRSPPEPTEIPLTRWQAPNDAATVDLDDDTYSVGTELHASGRCSPCIFVGTARGCRNGRDCDHCHMPHVRPKVSRPCKAKRERMNKFLNAMEQRIADDPHVVDQLMQSSGSFMHHDMVKQKLRRLQQRYMDLKDGGQPDADQFCPEATLDQSKAMRASHDVNGRDKDARSCQRLSF
eukprot:TRINITY_DN8114_c0_g1_i2.p1 TRINITY_DN8114_c0_g1~~TRINITY_DN8114_c0_g1_i2.p1  ORF type:complete len:263 (+),score=26.01 TRINITY_DN8114_c0_g1_i2:90-791(+)